VLGSSAKTVSKRLFKDTSPAHQTLFLVSFPISEQTETTRSPGQNSRSKLQLINCSDQAKKVCRLLAADVPQMTLSTTSDEFSVATNPDGSFQLLSTKLQQDQAAVSSATLPCHTKNQFILTATSLNRTFSLLSVDADLLLDPQGFHSFLENRCFVISGHLEPKHYLQQDPRQPLPTHLAAQDLPPENLLVIGHLSLVYNAWLPVLKAMKAVATGRVVREKLRRKDVSGGWDSIHLILDSYCQGWKSRSTPHVQPQNRLVYVPKPVNTVAQPRMPLRNRSSSRKYAPAAVVGSRPTRQVAPQSASHGEAPYGTVATPPPSAPPSPPQTSDHAQPAPPPTSQGESSSDSNGGHQPVPLPSSSVSVSSAPGPSTQLPAPPMNARPSPAPNQSGQDSSPPKVAPPLTVSPTTSHPAPALVSTTDRPEVPIRSQIPHPRANPPVMPQLYEGPGPIVEISQEELTHLLCSARQKGTGKMLFHLFRIESDMDNPGSAMVYYRERLIRGLHVQRKQIEPPQGSKVMCVFGCRPTCHLSNVKDAREHQRPRVSNDGAGRCQSFPQGLKCRNRHEFSHRKSLDNNPVVVYYREDKEGHWLTQLHSLGRSLLVFAYQELKIHDQKMVDLWIYHNNKE